MSVRGILILSTEVEVSGVGLLYSNVEDSTRARVGNAIVLHVTDAQVSEFVRRKHSLKGEEVIVRGVVREEKSRRSELVRLAIDVHAITVIDIPSLNKKQ